MTASAEKCYFNKIECLGEQLVPLLPDYDQMGNLYLVPGLKLGPYPGKLDEADLLPGDVLVWYESMGGKQHDLIREATQGPYTHVGIYIGNGQSIDAGPQGVKRVAVTDLINYFEVGDVMRYEGLKPDRLEMAVAKALTFEGFRYAWLDAIGMAIRRVAFWREVRAFRKPRWALIGCMGKKLIARRKIKGPPINAIYCSQMVIEAYAEAVSFPDDEVVSGVFSPNDLLLQNVFQYQGFLSKKANPDYHPLAVNADIPRPSTLTWVVSWIRFAKAFAGFKS